MRFVPPGASPGATFRFWVREESGGGRGMISMAYRASNPKRNWSQARLRKNSDYQRVYKAGRKQFSSSMSYFFRLRVQDELATLYTGPRVGLTVGRVLGKAVERNRIKRRMREAVRIHLDLLPPRADVVLHPRRLVLDMEFAALEREIAKIFSTVFAQAEAAQPRRAGAQG